MELYSLLDDDVLLRLMFGAEHYDENEVKNAAISTDDLKERGFSLDVYCLKPKSAIETRIASQIARAIEKKGEDQSDRKIAYISKLINSDLLSCVDEQEKQLFETFHDPVSDNYAHAKLLCVNKEKTRSYYVYARNKIRPMLLKSICCFSDYDFSQ